MRARGLNQKSRRDGFSLVEAVIAILVLMVLVIGSMAYGYHSRCQVRLAQARETAGRLAVLLLESWKGAADPALYNPVLEFGEELSIADSAVGPGPAESFDGAATVSLGNYQLGTPQAPYYVSLLSQPATATEPQKFHVRLAWRRDFADGPLEEPFDSFELTDYARN